MTNNNYIRKIINDYCVLDTETTGLNPLFERIIEVGILRVRDDRIVDKYSQLIDDKHAILIQGITSKSLEIRGFCNFVDRK